jgi:hypothetical protein
MLVVSATVAVVDPAVEVVNVASLPGFVIVVVV